MDREVEEHIKKIYNEIERLKIMLLKVAKNEEDYSDLIQLGTKGDK